MGCEQNLTLDCISSRESMFNVAAHVCIQRFSEPNDGARRISNPRCLTSQCYSSCVIKSKQIVTLQHQSSGSFSVFNVWFMHGMKIGLSCILSLVWVSIIAHNGAFSVSSGRPWSQAQLPTPGYINWSKPPTSADCSYSLHAFNWPTDFLHAARLQISSRAHYESCLSLPTLLLHHRFICMGFASHLHRSSSFTCCVRQTKLV